MNRESSRSHSIFTVIVEGSHFNEDGSQHITVGKLNLVDLAGTSKYKAPNGSPRPGPSATASRRPSPSTSR